MDCSWIKIYDAPENGNLLNPNTLYAGEIIYVDISELPSQYEFVAWKDLQGNLLDDTVITKVDGGRYKTTASCGGGFIAYVKTKEEEICLVVVECNPSEGTVQRGDRYDVCGATITISAIPECCYDFDKWSDSDVDHNTENPRDVLVMRGINTYTANFMEKEFQLSVSTNDDGMGTVTVSPNIVKCGGRFTLTATPSDNCVFDHWEPGDDKNTSLTITYKCGDPVEYMAYFNKIPIYTITYHHNCPGTTKPDIIDSFRIGDSVTYRTVSEYGYTFLGWSFSPNIIVPDIEPGANGLFDNDSNIELYGVWSAKEKYSVRYFGKPGEPDYVWPDMDYAYEGESVTLMTLSSQGDFNFKGWVVVKQGEAYDPEALPITGQVEMLEGGLDAHSVWSNDTTYTLRYNMNDGSGTVININNIASGQSVTLKSPGDLGFTYPYHEFVAWDRNGSTYTPGAIMTFNDSDIDLSAIWRTNDVTLTYDVSSADVGTVAPNPVTVYSGMEVTLDSGDGITKTGYTFGGWSSTDGGFALNSPITLNSNMTVYPVWIRESMYTVTYNSRTCPQTDTNQYRSGDTVNVLECTCISETGCKCSGWLDQNGETHLNGTHFTITQNMVMSEYWDCCNVKIATNDKTAILTINGEKVEWDTSINIDNDNFTFDITTEKGCCFEGWFDPATGLFINPCADGEIEKYTYKFIPTQYVSSIHSENVIEMDDIDFVNEINEPTLPYRENLIIYNIGTGEYRQAVPTCTGKEAYEFPCNGTAVAVIICNMFQETKHGEYEYYSYKGIFGSFYEFLDSLHDTEVFHEHNIVNINGVDRYFYYSRCNNG